MDSDKAVEKENFISVAVYIRDINNALKSLRTRVKGEITKINIYPTAVYFTIKDTKEDALLNCMIWRNVYEANGLDLKDGDEIIVTGAPEVYAPKGDFKLMARTIEYAGEGALKKAYEELGKKLASEGLFDDDRKQRLPDFPKKIGVITSKSGVVLQDFSSNLDRFGFSVTVVDSRVEGKDATHDLLASIKTLSKIDDLDVVVIMRGGGAWESLQPFNTESVVRAVANLQKPVITGIGHDVDVTLTELVADFGVSTPTAVAGKLNEPWEQFINSIDKSFSKINKLFESELNLRKVNLNNSSGKILRNFGRIISTKKENIGRFSEATRKQFRKIEKRISQANSALKSSTGILRSTIRLKKQQLNRGSANIVTMYKTDLLELEKSIKNHTSLVIESYKDKLKNHQDKISFIERNIKLNDPKRNMRLGYSLSYINARLVRDTSEAKTGDELITHLENGKFTSRVNKVG